MGRPRGNAADRGVALPAEAVPPAAVEAAHEAGLVYSTDDEPGIRRRRRGRRFAYAGPDGKLIHDPAVLERIRSRHAVGVENP